MNYDVIIVGGGMVGAALAAALGAGDRSRELKIAVLEAHYPQAYEADQALDLRVSAISRASENLLRNIGVWPQIKAMRSVAYRRMQVWDREGSGNTLFDSAEIAESHLGTIVENRLTQLALLQRLDDFENIDLLCPAELDHFEYEGDGLSVSLKDGRRLQCQLLIGADGARSRVRELAKIDSTRHEYGMNALVATIETALPEQDITWQRFTPYGPEALLPLPGNHASMVWYGTPEQTQQRLSMDDDEFISAMCRHFPKQLGDVTELIGKAAFPLIKSHAKAYAVPRIALAGDSAHTIHPLAGQGVNLGFLDAAALAEVLLKAHAQGRDLGSMHTLRRYARWRKGNNHIMQSAMDVFHHAFGEIQNPALILLRNSGLRLAENIAPIKQRVMRYAMGTEGDLPSLSKHSKR